MNDTLMTNRGSLTADRMKGKWMPTHKDNCPQPGFRYAATVRKNKATLADGTAGKVVMICKGCSATVLV